MCNSVCMTYYFEITAFIVSFCHDKSITQFILVVHFSVELEVLSYIPLKPKCWKINSQKPVGSTCNRIEGHIYWQC